MALKMLTKITGNFVTCLKITRNGKAVASLPLPVPGIPWPRFCTQQLSDEVKIPVENLNLVTSLEAMGVDMTAVRKVDSVLLKKATTYEKSLKQFLTVKGADTMMVASIISRYPRAITRHYEVLEEMWNIWKGILGTDATVLSVAQRSPESFFRTSNIENLLKNIQYLQTLGLPPKVLSQLMVKSPRTFANSIELNQHNVQYLLKLCCQLGGENPREFVRDLISRNIFILAKSTNRIQSNVEHMKSLLKLDNDALLLWIQAGGADILTLSYGYFENNYKGVHAKLQSLGCTESEISLYFLTSPKVLLMTTVLFENKIDILMECGAGVSEILNNPTILSLHTNSLKSKVKALTESGYDFRTSGFGVLLLNQTKFISKLKTQHNSGSLDENVGQCCDGDSH